MTSPSNLSSARRDGPQREPTMREVATLAGVSIKTVDTHRTSAMKKLNLRSAVDLVRYAIRNKLILP